MADTTNFGWTKPTVGGDSGSWGGILNTALDDIDTDLDTARDAAVAALPKAGGTMTGDIDALGISYTAVNLGSSLSGATALNLDTGNFFYGTMTGAITISFSNIPASGLTPFVTIKLINTSGNTITWPAGVRWPSVASAPSVFTAGRAQVFVLFTHDGGTKWFAQWVPEYTA